MELTNGFKYNDGRWFGSEAMWKSSYNALVGYLRDSVPRWDETYRPSGVRRPTRRSKLWNPLNSRRTSRSTCDERIASVMARPLIIMHGAPDSSSARAKRGIQDLVAKTIGRREAGESAGRVLHPRHGARRKQFDSLIPEQIDALEAMSTISRAMGAVSARSPPSSDLPREPSRVR